jgi:signal transduction histidine kinase
MRWPIRYQLFIPLLTLLLGVVGISTWTALDSAKAARQEIETQVRQVAHTLSASRHVPLTNLTVLEQMKGLSGADYLLIIGGGARLTTLPTANIDLPPGEVVVEDWQTLYLGPRVTVARQAYLGGGIRLPPRADIPEGAILYILYPETLWRTARWEAVRPSLVLGGFAGLASVVLAVGVGRHLGRRVQELERRTRLIASGDFSPMPLPRRNDELRDLSRSVNEMAQQLAHLQEAMQRSERLRLLGQVSGGLVHQLRNSLTGVRLAVQLHARECTAHRAPHSAQEELASDTDTEPLDVALRQLALLETHLKRFLDLGRSDGLRREPCSLRQLIDDLVALLRPRCRHAHIDLRWISPSADNTILGDPGQLEQLVLNVLSNAVDAAGPGGWIEIVMHNDLAPDRVVIAVSDSGPGPSQELAQRLFEPFVTGKPEGVGLGLAVARQVAEAHGGRITWRRETDRTSFHIELPTGHGSRQEPSR